QIASLLTTINREKERISMHGVREALLEQQAKQLGFPLQKVRLPDQVSMPQYDALMSKALQSFWDKGIRRAVFGDIFLEDLRDYREQRLKQAGFEALFPLWQQSTQALADEFIILGFKAVVACVDGSKLDCSFVGRPYDHQFLADLPATVDPCGENGEFHTFVYDGPVFNNPVFFDPGEMVHKSYFLKTTDADEGHQNDSLKKEEKGFWFCDLLPK